MMIVMFLKINLTHLRFWRHFEAKKTWVSVVVPPLLVLVDLLLKHSQSLTSTSQNIMTLAAEITNNVIMTVNIRSELLSPAPTSPRSSSTWEGSPSRRPWLHLPPCQLPFSLSPHSPPDFDSSFRNSHKKRSVDDNLYEDHLLRRLHLHLLWRLIFILRKHFNWTHFAILTFSQHWYIVKFSSTTTINKQQSITLAMFFVLQLLSTAFSPLNSVEFRLTWSRWWGKCSKKEKF